VQQAPRPRRLLAVLFLDMVGSTQVASDLGDRRWRELLSRFRRTVRTQLKRYEGHEEDTAGDGFFATFASPEQAVRAADAIVRSVQAHGVDVRCGVHFGEVEMVDGGLAGIAVHIGSRVMSLAGPTEVLVTSTVRDLVTGSGMAFEDLSAHELKGVPGTWQLFALRAIDGQAATAPLLGSDAAERLAAVVAAGSSRRLAPLVVGFGGLVLVGVVLWLLLGRGGGHAAAGGSPSPGVASHPVATGSTPGGSPSPTAMATVDQAVVRLNPESGDVHVVATEVMQGGLGGTRFLAAGEGGVWVSGNGLVEVDPATGATRSYATGGGNVVVGDGEVWTATATGSNNAFHPAAAMIDPATHTVRTIRFPGTYTSLHGTVAIADGYVWLAYQGRLLRTDPSHGGFTEVPHQGSVDLVSAYGQEVWGTDFIAGVLRQIDPNLARVEQTHMLQFGPDAISVGPAGLWVANISGSIAFPVDEETGQPGAPVGVGTGPVAVAVGSKYVWVANRDDDTVTRIDPATNRTTTFPVPGSPVAVAVDQRTDTPWVYVT
jgi:YVTN family beta-propeller protein